MAEENKALDEQQDGGTLTFDEILEDKEYQREFDRRVTKAIETAKAKWEAKADSTKAQWEAEAETAKNTAVAEATATLNAELTKAMIQTELVKAKARDIEVIMPLIDTAKVSRTEKGLEGLEEQLTELKTSKSYLFEAAENNPQPKGKSGLQHGGNDGDGDDAKIRRIMGLPQK